MSACRFERPKFFLFFLSDYRLIEEICIHLHLFYCTLIWLPLEVHLQGICILYSFFYSDFMLELNDPFLTFPPFISFCVLKAWNLFAVIFLFLDSADLACFSFSSWRHIILVWSWNRCTVPQPIHFFCYSRAFLPFFILFSGFVIYSSLPKRKRLNLIAVPHLQLHHSVLLCTLASQLEGCHLDCWLGVSGWLYDGLPVCPRLTLPVIKAFSTNNCLKSWFTENQMKSRKKVRSPV